jgi:hypothetical protein
MGKKVGQIIENFSKNNQKLKPYNIIRFYT